MDSESKRSQKEKELRTEAKIKTEGDSTSKSEVIDSKTQGMAAPGKADTPSAFDHLDRAKYVNAVAALISHDRTETPLTIGIYGEWGSGKSSFIKQLESLLKRKNQVVNFNAWRCSGAEDLWATLIGAVSTALDKQLSFFRRLRFILSSQYSFQTRKKIRKLGGRVAAAAKKIENWIVIPITGSGFLYFIGMKGSIVLPWANIYSINLMANIVGILAFGLSVSVIIIKLKRIMKMPFTTQFSIYQSSMKVNNEERRKMTQMDLNEISTLLGSEMKKLKKRIIVLLDDLDRCPPDKIIDILEAVNLFFEGLPFIVVFGLSPTVVSRAIAKEYEFLLDRDSENQDRELFGRSFLQKIIHIPFQLPPAKNIGKYLGNLISLSSDEERGKKIKRPAYHGREYFKGLTFFQKIMRLPMRLYIDALTGALRSRKLEPDQAMSSDIFIRLIYSLPSTDEQEEWIEKQIEFDRELFRTYFHENIFRLRNIPKLPFQLNRIANIQKEVREKVFQKELQVEKVDSDILLEFSKCLYGNPRTIKRFVNIYQLTKVINTQHPIKDQVSMKELTVWLVLFQNWPQESANLYFNIAQKNMSYEKAWEEIGKLKSTAQEFKDFGGSYGSDLALLPDRKSAFEIVGCFSFLPPYESG